jgi:dsRNA-specific ribonuclease
LVSKDYQKHPTENRAINQVYKELATVGFAKGLARFVYICPMNAQIFGHVVTEEIMGVVMEAIIGAVKIESNRVETTRNVVDSLGLLEPWMHPDLAPGEFVFLDQSPTQKLTAQ